jgi:leucyl aminopeptidase (aminopeptidase T)
VVAAALAGADAIISPTSTALSFTPALGEALKSGARAIVMTAVRSDALTGGAGLADYEEVYRATQPFVEALEAGKEIRVTCPHGSDFTASIDGAEYHIGASFAREPGQISGYPSGEAWGVPVTGSGDGVLIADGTAHMLGEIREPIRTTWKNGRCIKIEGEEQAGQLRRILEGVENGDNLGELSIGTNAWARASGITEHKKLFGTVQFALGNSVVGGEVRSAVHIDMMMLRPTVEVDGRVILKDQECQL